MAQAGATTIRKGDTVPTLTRTITEEMVIAYENLFERIAARSDWKASFHADREAASQTMYQEPIAQGVLTEALFSVLLTRWLPDLQGLDRRRHPHHQVYRPSLVRRHPNLQRRSR